MIRKPLRPLATILRARAEGANPDAIERENIRARHEAGRDKERQRAEGRILMLCVFFLAGFCLIGMRMGQLAGLEPAEPRARATGNSIIAARADITDRKGRILATNLTTHSLYAQPPIMVDPIHAAEQLAAIFPEMDAEKLKAQFTGERKFLWIKRNISPEQQQAVHDIGDPGLLFGPREMRLYPNGRLAAHILGGAGFGREAVNSAEVVGRGGVEKQFDAYLRDPANDGAPLQLSIDLTIQDTVERVLHGGINLMNAKGAASILMDIHSGEIIAMASLPDFDPNERPRPLTEGDQSDSPLFNRAVLGVYELGSTFKVLTTAQALEENLVNPNTMLDTRQPYTWGKFKINDFHYYGPEQSVTEILVNSSNIGTARMATAIGVDRHKEFLGSLGFFEPTPVELTEARAGKPLLPPNWSEISTITISYGHGLSASPLHLATAYASVLNGGTRVEPTLMKQDGPQNGERVISQATSDTVLDLMRKVVTEGTASMAEVEGYGVAAKTGTADKPRPQGGYYEDKVIATFASVFPVHDPKYVLIVSLDEPEIVAANEERRTAGWTAVPVGAEIIRRSAPLLGLRPVIEPQSQAALTLTSN